MNLMEQEAMKQSLVTSYVQYMRVSQRDTYGLAIPAARSCFYARVSMALEERYNKNGARLIQKGEYPMDTRKATIRRWWQTVKTYWQMMYWQNKVAIICICIAVICAIINGARILFL